MGTPWEPCISPIHYWMLCDINNPLCLKLHLPLSNAALTKTGACKSMQPLNMTGE